MSPNSISRPQLFLIHTLFGQFAQSSLQVLPGHEREARLEFIASVCGRSVLSSKDLTRIEAADVIDRLQMSLGREPRPYSRPRSRQAARAAGTHGRKGFETNELAIASERDLARIDKALNRLGWDRQHFESWLSSPSSPLGASVPIRTVAQANKVWWALKNMLKSAGRWRKEKGTGTDHRPEQKVAI